MLKGMSKMSIKNFFTFTGILCFSLNLHSINLDRLVLEPGFKISIFAENLSSPRQMAEGQNGTIFIAERSGQIVAVTDSDKNGEADSKKVIAKNLEYSTGISIFNGDLYFSEISKIWKIENIENWLKSNSSNIDLPKKILVTDQLPSDTWHGWKWLKHDQKGQLYFNVGAPCNICLSENSQYASILRINQSKI